MGRGSSPTSRRSPAWRVKSFACRISFISSAAGFVKPEKFAACSKPPASVPSSPSGCWLWGFDCPPFFLILRRRFSGGYMVGLLSIVFIAIVIAVLALGSALDKSSSRAYLLRERLRAVDSAARRGSSPEVEILRDELLSGIPALNKLLARWS